MESINNALDYLSSGSRRELTTYKNDPPKYSTLPERDFSTGRSKSKGDIELKCECYITEVNKDSSDGEYYGPQKDVTKLYERNEDMTFGSHSRRSRSAYPRKGDYEIDMPVIKGERSDRDVPGLNNEKLNQLIELINQMPSRRHADRHDINRVQNDKDRNWENERYPREKYHEDDTQMRGLKDRFIGGIFGSSRFGQNKNDQCTTSSTSSESQSKFGFRFGGKTTNEREKGKSRWSKLNKSKIADHVDKCQEFEPKKVCGAEMDMVPCMVPRVKCCGYESTCCGPSKCCASSGNANSGSECCLKKFCKKKCFVPKCVMVPCGELKCCADKKPADNCWNFKEEYYDGADEEYMRGRMNRGRRYSGDYGAEGPINAPRMRRFSGDYDERYLNGNMAAGPFLGGINNALPGGALPGINNALVGGANNGLIGGVNNALLGGVGNNGILGGVNNALLGGIGNNGIIGGVNNALLGGVGNNGIIGGVNNALLGGVGNNGILGGVNSALLGGVNGMNAGNFNMGMNNMAMSGQMTGNMTGMNCMAATNRLSNSLMALNETIGGIANKLPQLTPGVGMNSSGAGMMQTSGFNGGFNAISTGAGVAGPNAPYGGMSGASNPLMSTQTFGQSYNMQTSSEAMNNISTRYGGSLEELRNIPGGYNPPEVKYPSLPSSPFKPTRGSPLVTGSIGSNLNVFGSAEGDDEYEIQYIEPDMEEYNRKVKEALEKAEQKRQELIRQRDEEVARKRVEMERWVEEEYERRKAEAKSKQEAEIQARKLKIQSDFKKQEQDILQSFTQKLKLIQDNETEKRMKYEQALAEANQRSQPLKEQFAFVKQQMLELEATKAQLLQQEAERKRFLDMLAQQIQTVGSVPAYTTNAEKEKELLANFCRKMSSIKSQEKKSLEDAANIPVPLVEKPKMPEIPIPEIPEVIPEHIPMPERREIRIPKRRAAPSPSPLPSVICATPCCIPTPPPCVPSPPPQAYCIPTAPVMPLSQYPSACYMPCTPCNMHQGGNYGMGYYNTGASGGWY